MRSPPHRFTRGLVALLMAAGVALGASAGGAQSAPPSPALARCAALTVVAGEDVPPGTRIAVSADGRRIARYFHTPRGAEIQIQDRGSPATRRFTVEPTSLPPGIVWRITEVAFAPAGHLLAVQSLGAVWVLSAEKGELLYPIAADAEKQLYPGQLQLTDNRLLLAFWPPESLLAASAPTKPVEVRLYEAASGQLLKTLLVPLETPDAWTRLALSPAGDQLAVLERATRWPGKGRLTLYRVADGKPLWRIKLGAEDLAWTLETSELVTLGGELAWLDAATGKKRRAAPRKIRFSEYQKLRLQDAAHAALGYFLRYNPLKRTLALQDAREPQWVLWRLSNGATRCELRLAEAERVDAWLTAGGEVVALEEAYDLRPGLRMLRAARIVTYRLVTP